MVVHVAQLAAIGLLIWLTAAVAIELTRGLLWLLRQPAVVSAWVFVVEFVDPASAFRLGGERRWR